MLTLSHHGVRRLFATHPRGFFATQNGALATVANKNDVTAQGLYCVSVCMALHCAINGGGNFFMVC